MQKTQPQKTGTRRCAVEVTKSDVFGKGRYDTFPLSNVDWKHPAGLAYSPSCTEYLSDLCKLLGRKIVS